MLSGVDKIFNEYIIVHEDKKYDKQLCELVGMDLKLYRRILENWFNGTMGRYNIMFNSKKDAEKAYEWFKKQLQEREK